MFDCLLIREWQQPPPVFSLPRPFVRSRRVSKVNRASSLPHRIPRQVQLKRPPSERLASTTTRIPRPDLLCETSTPRPATPHSRDTTYHISPPSRNTTPTKQARATPPPHLPGRLRGHTRSVTIASNKKGHRSRNSLLGGSPEGHYQPLSGASSLASLHNQPQQPPLHASYSPGGYHDRQGLTQGNIGIGIPPEKKMYFPQTKWTRAFLAIAIVQAIIALALEAFVFAEFQTSLDDDSPEIRTIPTYLAIFIFGFFYELLLVWDALRLKNTIQVIGLCMYNLGMMTYSGVQMEQVNEAVVELGADIEPGTWAYLKPCLVAVPCVLALGTVLMTFVAWKLYGEFAWTIYKHISADLRLKRRFLTYQIYIALLKFDFFFFLGFAVQFLVIVKNNTISEYALTIAALPIIVGLLILAAFFVRRESAIGHSFIIILYLAAMAYFIFKLFRMWDSERAEEYKSAGGRSMLTTFAVFAILLLITTIGTAVAVMLNFNKGLAPHIQTRKVPDPEGGKYGGSYAPDHYPPGQSHQLGAVPNRMTID